MLSRFCGLSLKTVRLARIVQFTAQNGLPVSSSTLSQQSNYATTERNFDVNHKSLESIIKQLKFRIENKDRLTKDDLKKLLTKLTTQRANAEQALEILSCCTFARLGENQTPVVENIWKELKTQNDDLKIQHYNCVLSFARDKANIELAEDIFNEMQKNGIKPDAYSYQLLLGTYCKVGKIEKAIEVLDMMDKENMYINESTFNNLVQCHCICGNIEAANETIANLKEAGFKLNMYTFEQLLKFYAGAGDLEGIEKTIDQIKGENLELLNRDIFKIICELAANGHTEKIESLFSHLKPTIEMRRSLQNAISMFVERRQSPIVPKILERADGDVKGKIRYLIEEMIRCGTPEPEFKETIATIEAMGVKIEENFDLFKPVLDGPSEDIIRRLLTHMQQKSIPITENVFEKLFQMAAKKDVTDVSNVINLMCNTFKIQPQFTFVRDQILPGMKFKENPQLAFGKLRATHIHPWITTLAVITGCLFNKDIKTAYEFASSETRIFYGRDLIKRPLLNAFASTQDIEAFVQFVRLIHDSFTQINGYYKDGTPLTESEIQLKQKTFIDELLWESISNRRTDTQLVTELLKSFANEGLTISPKVADKIQTHLQVERETQIGRLLKKLSTEPLTLRPIEVKRRASSVMQQLSSVDLQNILEVKQAQGHSAAATEKLLFLAYIREGNTAEIESILAKDRIALSNSDYAQLIELYTRNGNLENALNILKRICANNSSFKLDRIKVAKLVRLMIDRGNDFNEIDALMLAHRPDKPEYRIFKFEHLFDQLASSGSHKLAEKLFDALIKYNYIEPTPQATGPLIQAYLNAGKFEEAVSKYEYFATEFKLVPMTLVLFIKLIKNNQIELLQRAFDINERIHGEQNAMYRLAFAFIECGQDRQARIILENNRLKNITQTINRECRRYVQYDRINALKVLLNATKGLFCDRHVIYQSLLDIYTKTNNATDALELWCEYSTDDGILPKPQFKTALIALLKANNMQIPAELMESREKNENTKQSKETFEKQTIKN